MFAIVDKARKNPEATAAAALALAAQIPHAQHVFFEWGHAQGFGGALNAWVYAVAVESAVFFFVLRGWAWVSWGFALASVGVNVAYYSIAHAAQFGPGFMFDPGLFSVTWSMWLLSIILPVAVAAFSHATAGHIPDMYHLGGRTEPEPESKPVKTEPKPKTAAAFIPPTLDPKMRKPVQVKTGSGELDDKDRAILEFLRINGPSSNKAEIAAAAGLTSGAVERKSTRGTGRMGRLVKLEESGYVERDGDAWRIVDVKPETNGKGSPVEVLESVAIA